MWSYATNGTLAKASIENEITDREGLLYLGANGLYTEVSGSTDTVNKNLNAILSNTTLKRACCLGNKKITVRIPVPDPDYVHGGAYAGIESTYGYIDKDIEIDLSDCDKLPNGPWNAGSRSCNNFYTVYCKNIKEQFRKSSDGNFDFVDFSNYSPECACYSDIPESAKDQSNPYKSIPGIPRKCYLPSCDDNSGAYLDPSSRGQTCTQQICQNVTQIIGSVIGGSIDTSGAKNNINCSILPSGTTTSGTSSTTPTQPSTTPTTPTPTQPSTPAIIPIVQPTTTTTPTEQPQPTTSVNIWERYKWLIIGGGGGLALLILIIVILISIK